MHRQTLSLRRSHSKFSECSPEPRTRKGAEFAFECTAAATSRPRNRASSRDNERNHIFSLLYRRLSFVSKRASGTSESILLTHTPRAAVAHANSQRLGDLRYHRRAPFAAQLVDGTLKHRRRALPESSAGGSVAHSKWECCSAERSSGAARALRLHATQYTWGVDQRPNASFGRG